MGLRRSIIIKTPKKENVFENMRQLFYQYYARKILPAIQILENDKLR